MMWCALLAQCRTHTKCGSTVEHTFVHSLQAAAQLWCNAMVMITIQHKTGQCAVTASQQCSGLSSCRKLRVRECVQMHAALVMYCAESATANTTCSFDC